VYDVVVKKVHVRYLISWWVSCTRSYRTNAQLERCSKYKFLSTPNSELRPVEFRLNMLCYWRPWHCIGRCAFDHFFIILYVIRNIYSTSCTSYIISVLGNTFDDTLIPLGFSSAPTPFRLRWRKTGSYKMRKWARCSFVGFGIFPIFKHGSTQTS